MKRLFNIIVFDYPRCGKPLIIWWLYCAAVAVLGLWAVLSPESQAPDPVLMLSLEAFGAILLAVLIGLIIQPHSPGRLNSFLNGRPVAPGELVLARLLLIALILLLPLFIAKIVPLVYLEPHFWALSAYTVKFWANFGGAAVLLAALAAVSKTTSTYLTRCILLLCLLGVTAELASANWRPSPDEWIAVPYPEAARLLWSVAISLVAGFAAACGLLHIYRGHRSWILGGIIAVTLLSLAAFGPLIKFRQDPNHGVSPLPNGTANLSSATVQASRCSTTGSYQRWKVTSEGSAQSSSLFVQAKPPYLESNNEEFWSIVGQVEIMDIHPDFSYYASLVTAQWMAPNGVVVDYDPPPEVRAKQSFPVHIAGPGPTTEQLNTLLGTPPEPPDNLYIPHRAIRAPVMLFGAWSSTYETFKTVPGQLQLRLRIDFYKHEIGFRIPLNEPASIRQPYGIFRLVSSESTDRSFKVSFTQLSGGVHWIKPSAFRTYKRADWIIYDPVTKRRWTPRGIGSRSGNTCILIDNSMAFRRMSLDFYYEERDGYAPELLDSADSSLIRIRSQYLGSSEIDIVIDDFPLVTQAALDL